MDFSSSVKRRNRRIKTEGGEYGRRLQLYLYPPMSDITLEEFEDVATARQKMLREIGNLKEKLTRGDIDRGMYEDQIKDKTKVFPLNQPKDRERDHISHYILRLAYCKSEDQRKWFLNQEVELLKSRVKNASIEEVCHMVQEYNRYIPLERRVLSRPSDLDNPTRDERLLAEEVWRFYGILDNSCECFKVEFTQVLDLVKRRAVVVKQGCVYFPANKKKDLLVSLICNKFRTLLSQDLVRMVTYMGVVEQDDRLTPVLQKLKGQYYGHDFSDTASELGEHIRLAQINTFAKESFPPCMRHLHDSLRRDHHLKHFGRLQYGLFLKSIGMSLEEALAFWREEFTRKMDMDQFEKKYAYNVRHSFGKEGKRANYTAYSCMRIITSNTPATGDHHGCPFKHWDHTHIEEKMLEYGIPQKQVSKITSYSQNQHYQLACQKYYEIVHALPQANFSLEHPSQFYYESRKVRGGVASKGGMATMEAKKEEKVEGLEGISISDFTADDMEF